MTKITLFNYDALTAEELVTAKEEEKFLKDAISRLSYSRQDHLTVAHSLYKIRQKHGYQSNLYMDSLEAIKQNVEGWDDKFFRQRIFNAYKGYMALPGSWEDKEFIFKLNPSMSALTECQFIQGEKRMEFLQSLKKLKKFPTLKQIGAGNASAPKPQPSVSSGAVADNQFVYSDWKQSEVANSLPQIPADPEPYTSTTPVTAEFEMPTAQEMQPVNITPIATHIEDEQEHLLRQMIVCLEKINMDELFVSDERKALIRPYSQQLEMLHDMATSIKSNRPAYI